MRRAIRVALAGCLVALATPAEAQPRWAPVEPAAPPADPEPAATDASPQAETPWAAGVSAEQKARASELLARGNELLVQNRYAAALEQYERATREWDHPAIRANMVLCFINLGMTIEAYESALLALAYGEAPHRKPEVYAETVNYRTLLEAQIGTVAVTCDEPGAEVTLDGQDLLTCPGRARRHLRAGRHQIVARKRGFLTITRHFEAVGGRTRAIDLDLQTLSTAARTERRWATWKPWAVVGSGAGLALLGGLLQLKARSDIARHDADLERLCGADGCGDGEVPASVSALESRATLENRLAVGAMITGGAVAAIGLVGVYLNQPRTILPDESGFGRRSARRIEPVFTPTAVGLGLGGTF